MGGGVWWWCGGWWVYPVYPTPGTPPRVHRAARRTGARLPAARRCSAGPRLRENGPWGSGGPVRARKGPCKGHSGLEVRRRAARLAVGQPGLPL